MMIMKKVIFLVMLVASFSLVSCEKEQHAENLKVEYYADFEIVGGTPYILPIGTPWADPGIKATANGDDVSDQLIIEDGVDETTIGSYTVTYKYVNASGFSNSTSRTVYVCNPEVTTDISGTYTSIDGTYRDNKKGTLTPYPGFKVKITKICPGFFQINDMLAQYYSEYVGYGPAYNYSYDFDADANWSLNTDNTIDMVGGGYVGAWGDYAGPLTGAVYDPSTETISYVITYSEMDFHVVMQKDN